MTTLDPEIARVLVEEVLRQAKSTGSVKNALSRALLIYPFYDELVSGVKEEDLETIIAMDSSSDTHTRYLAAALARGIKNNTRLRAHYIDKWTRATTPQDQLMALFKATDYAGIPQTLHQEMYAFIQAHWTLWASDVRTWHLVPLGAARERLANQMFPTSKAWVYLCVAAVDEDALSVNELLKKYTQFEDAFTQYVAVDLLGGRG